MNLFKRSELLNKIIEDLELELQVETKMYEDGFIYDHSRIDFLNAHLEAVKEWAQQEDKICMAMQGRRI